MSKYELTVGLEIHCHLNTRTKIFCRCANAEAEPNTNVCPACLGMPGALPVVSRATIEKTILAGLAFDCKINNLSVFERKNYFYPDLPKGYQITQNDFPICLGGQVALAGGKKIRLNRIHLEEDAGKLVHDEVRGETLVDYNRGGCALIEMVTEPDISSASEAVAFLEEVRSRLLFSGVSFARMEEGELRFDVNISLKKKGAKKFGNRVEMKNLNSFKMVARAIEFEANRQEQLLENGREVAVETRKWNDGKGISTPMRSKEASTDYRYFPDPDQYPIRITKDDVAKLRGALPKLAHVLRKEFIDLGLPEYDSDILTRDKTLATFFQDCHSLNINAKELSNWILGDVLSRATNFEIKIAPTQLVDVINMVNSNQITRKNAPVLLDSLWGVNKGAKDVAGKLGLLGGVDASELGKIIDEILGNNPKAVADNATTFLMGQIMKATKGKADANAAQTLLQEKLG